MISAHSQFIRAGGDGAASGSSHGETGRRLRLGVGAAAILALVAWSVLDGGPMADRARLPAGEQPAVAEAQPAFDGRGKWGGY